jgi:hypothetical protein
VSCVVSVVSLGFVMACSGAVVVLGRCVALDRRDGVAVGVMGGVLVHTLTLSLGGRGDIGAAP